MTEFREQRHWVTDAHGRPLDLTSNGQVPPVAADSRAARRGQRIPVVVGVTAVLVGGLLVVVVLVVIRDIVMTLAGTSVTGVILKALLTPSKRRER